MQALSATKASADELAAIRQLLDQQINIQAEGDAK
jgi:hypothetical protein